MNIPPATLAAQHDRALRDWPWIHDVERAHGLPPHLLCAVGSRETNSRNIAGDYSQRAGEDAPRYHGFGVWQRDVGNGTPPGWMDDVRAQADWSANLLASNFRACGSWVGACARYNSGQCKDQYTTGHDYGADVMARQAWLALHSLTPEDTDMTDDQLNRLIATLDAHEDRRRDDIKLHAEEVREQELANARRAEGEEDTVQAEILGLLRRVAAKVGA